MYAPINYNKSGISVNLRTPVGSFLVDVFLQWDVSNLMKSLLTHALLVLSRKTVPTLHPKYYKMTTATNV